MPNPRAGARIESQVRSGAELQGAYNCLTKSLQQKFLEGYIFAKAYLLIVRKVKNVMTREFKLLVENPDRYERLEVF